MLNQEEQARVQRAMNDRKSIPKAARSVVSKSLRDWREARGYSRTEAGRQIGVSASAIDTWETQRCVPDAARIATIENVYARVGEFEPMLLAALNTPEPPAVEKRAKRTKPKKKRTLTKTAQSEAPTKKLYTNGASLTQAKARAPLWFELTGSIEVRLCSKSGIVFQKTLEPAQLTPQQISNLLFGSR